MLTTVNLDDQPLLKANEVDNIRPEWLLPLELVATEAVGSQMAPQKIFRISLRRPKLFREGKPGCCRQGDHPVTTFVAFTNRSCPVNSR